MASNPSEVEPDQHATPPAYYVEARSPNGALVAWHYADTRGYAERWYETLLARYQGLPVTLVLAERVTVVADTTWLDGATAWRIRSRYHRV